VRFSKAPLDTALEDHAPASCTKAATATGAAIRAEAQHVSATADAAHFAELAAIGLFDPAAEADVDKALDDVLKGLRALEGLEEGGPARVSHVSRGFASADFARLVEGAVKAKLKAEVEAEAKRLIKAKFVGETARGAVRQDEFDRFALNAATAVETALGLVHSALGQRWEAVARPGLVENYAHVLEKSPMGLKFYKRGVAHYLRYEVGYVAYGAVGAEGVVVLVLLGGKESIRVEVLAKSVVNAPAQFKEVELGRERWVWLATATIAKAKNYVAQIKPRLEGFETEVSGGAAGVEGLRGLLVTDAYGKEIGTPDPLLVKLFASHLEKVSVGVNRVTVTEAGPALVFRAVALDDKPFRELFGDIAERYGKNLWGVVEKAREMWREAVRKLYHDIMRVANEAAEVGKEDIQAGRKVLVEGLRRLFEEREREALNASHSDGALAIAVAGRLMVDIVNSPREWFSLLAGDGVVDIPNRTLGFSAKYAEVAEAVLRLLAVWAGAYGAEIRREEGMAVYASSEDAAKVLKAVLKDDVLKYAESLAKSWSGLAGSHAPKLISLLALAQLLGVVEGRWVVELWLAHKAATTPTPPEMAQVLDRLFARVESVDKVKWEERGVNIYFKLRGLKGAEGAVMLRSYTDFNSFRLYCESCSEASARRVLEAVAEWLRPAVEGLAAGEWPKWFRRALVLPAEVGWAVFLKLWARHNVSLPVPKDGGRELLRVEVLEARAGGTAKFRLWYYKWQETRPDKPYVDVEIFYKEKWQGFVGYLSANVVAGILREHLDEIANLLEREGIKGVSLMSDGRVLKFTGAFRDSVLAKLGVKPELPPGEPPAVQYLGGFKFKVGRQQVEFKEVVISGRYEFYAKLKFSTREEAESFARSLRAIGVDARIAGSVKAGYTVKLDSDAFFGLLAATNVEPPGLALLYSSKEEDFRVYASIEEGRMRLYFAVKHEGVWKVAEGVYGEKKIDLTRAERDVIETTRGAMVKALERLGLTAEVDEPTEHRDEEGKVKGYRLFLYGPHITPLLERAAEHVRAEPAEVRLEGRRIVVKAGGVEAEVEFKLLKGKEAMYLLANDVKQTLAIYRSLREVGVRVEITPRGVKVDREAMWALIAAVVERGEPSGLPAEVMLGVELLKVYSVSSMRLYIFRAEGVHYYFAVKTEKEWKAAGGKYSGRVVQIAGEAVQAIADAINAIYRKMGVERRVEVKYKSRVHYIDLTNVDLRLLGLSPLST